MTSLLQTVALVLLLDVPLLGCGGVHVPAVVVMKYDDFGTQLGVYEWLGFGWWQWQSEGSGDPRQQYDIKVVVYRGMSEADVRRRYPVDPAKLMDYRYISYEDAMLRLNALIEEDDVELLTKQLRSTRAYLHRRFEGK